MGPNSLHMFTGCKTVITVRENGQYYSELEESRYQGIEEKVTLKKKMS
jgi:hypothetical protein